MSKVRLSLALFTVVGILGCNADSVRGDSGWTGTVETLDSGVIVVSNPASGSWGADEGWRLEEIMRLGVVDEEGPELFGALAAVEMDEEGRLFVLDRQAREVRVFDEAGQFQGVIGGPGQGPGEFSDPVGLAWGQAGELWVVDQRSGQYLAFEPSGRYLRSETRPSSLFAPYWRGRIGAEGDFWEFAWVDVALGVQKQAMIRADPLHPDTVWIPAFDSEQYVLERGGEVFARRRVPFSPHVVWHMAAEDRIWWGTGGSFRLVHLDEHGDTVRIVQREFAQLPVTAADVEGVLSSQFYEQFQQMGGIIDRSRIPRTKPAYERIIEDDQGFLWVWPASGQEAERQFLDVFDPEGRYLGQVETPERISSAIVDPPPLIRGDRMIAIVRGEFDVPQVVVARVSGRQ